MSLKCLFALLPVIAIGGCVSTQELPLAPNMVRIDTQARGLLFTGQAVPATMRAAAKATLDRGFSHFSFAEAGLQQGSVVTGVIGNGTTNMNGSYGGGVINASSSSFSNSTVMHAPTAGAAVTVIMHHAKDAAAKNAFNAEDILKQYSQ